MTLFIIAVLVYTVFMLPLIVKTAKSNVKLVGPLYSFVALALLVFVAVTGLMYLSSVGQLAFGLWFYLPAAVSFFTGVVIGIAESV